MATKIQLRRDTAADWTSTNPTLAAGEFGWESDTNRFKIGDGSTAWTSLAYASDGDTAGITFVGDDSTGTLVSQNETFKIAGTQNVTTAVSGDTLTVTGPDLSSYATTSYVDTQDANIASDTLTFTNKTFDANGTGNSISNIETADIAAATLVTAADTIASNNNDTTIPTSAAVKAYADSVGGGGGTITALNNQAENRLVSIGATTTELDGEANLTFDGSTLTLTGSAVLDGVTIADNSITTNRSNDYLNISANGTGLVNISATDSRIADDSMYSSFWGTHTRGKNYMGVTQTISGDTADRTYANLLGMSTTVNASGTSSNFRMRGNVMFSNVDMAGYSQTNSFTSTGPTAATLYTSVKNSHASTASTLGMANGGIFGVYVSQNQASDLTLTEAAAVRGHLDVENYNAGDTALTTGYNFVSGAYASNLGAGTTSVTNHYGFYHKQAMGTNNYAFYDATNSLSVFGDIQTQGVSITDNLITTNRSNDDLLIGTNGTGRINISTDGSNFFSSNPLYETYFGSAIHTKTLGISNSETVDANTASRNYTVGVAQNTTLSGSSASNSNFRLRTMTMTNSMDMAGYSFTQASDVRGQVAGTFVSNVVNSSATASTLYHTLGLQGSVAAYDDNNYSEGDLTVTHAVANQGYMEVESAGTGSGTFTFTNGYNFRAKTYVGTGDTITNHYGFYHQAPTGGGTLTNKYAFYDATNSLSVFGDIQTQAVSITDNVISTNRSNDDLIINSSGTGRITLSTDGTRIEDSATYPKYHFSPALVKGVVLSHELTTNPDTLTAREYGHAIHLGNTLTASSSTNSNFRPRTCIFSSQTDMAGYDYTVAALSRGPTGLFASGTVHNSSATTASTLATVKAAQIATGCADYGSPTQDLTITNAIAVQGNVEIDYNGTGDVTITNGYNFYASHYKDSQSTGVATITNNYGFYYTGSDATNKYAFWDNANALSRFGAVILANQAGDPSTVTDSAHIYAKDVSASSEVFVRDEAGNVTQISPHNEAGEWQYWSENVKTGKKVRVNMERMIRRLEEITGEKFIENE